MLLCKSIPVIISVAQRVYPTSQPSLVGEVCWRQQTRIRDHRERQEKLEASAEEARALLSQRREVLDDVETITAYALDMSNFLRESELTERRSFIESFVKEIVVMPDNAVVRYTIPMPEDSPIGGRDAEEMALNGSVLSTVKPGGPEGTVDGTVFEMWLGKLAA